MTAFTQAASERGAQPLRESQLIARFLAEGDQADLPIIDAHHHFWDSVMRGWRMQD